MNQQELKQRKRQLKHEHRDTLVRLGIEAVRHALRFNPANRAELERGLQQIEDRERLNIEWPSTRHSPESLLFDATMLLAEMSRSEKYISGQMLNSILIRAWDVPYAIKNNRNASNESRAESDWHDQQIHPRVERAFAELRNGEAELRKLSKKKAA